MHSTFGQVASPRIADKQVAQKFVDKVKFALMSVARFNQSKNKGEEKVDTSNLKSGYCEELVAGSELEISEEYYCPINVGSDGRSRSKHQMAVCMSCLLIEDWLSGRNRTSPLTGARLQEIDLRANITLRKLIESFKEKFRRRVDREQKRTDLTISMQLRLSDLESQLMKQQSADRRQHHLI